jgi:NitT/TauT family transport system ATP-binding protein
LGGLVTPTAGSVVLGGPAAQRGATKASYAMVFQADSLFPWMSVESNATFGLRAQGTDARQARATAKQWLRRVGLPEEVDRLKPRQLSGGMRQRVNLVRALALEPRVILMDEPFASLDYQTREELQTELIRLARTQTMTTVFVTHDVPEAVLLADRIVVMDPQVRGIAQIFDVDWGSDRSLELKATSAFADLCGQVSHAVRGGQ